MIVLAVITISLQTGISSFTRLAQENTQTSLSNSFLTVVQFARNSALTKRQYVTLCASSDNTSCNTTAWEDGWIIFLDTDFDQVLDVGEDILQRSLNFSADHSLRRAESATPSTYLSSLQFLPSGFVLSTASFTLCDARGANAARGINLNLSGQTRVDAGIDANGVILTCPA